MEVRHAGEFFRQIAITADHAPAVAEDAHDAAVLPVGNFIPIRSFKDTEQVMRGIALLCGLLDLFYETRPRSFLQVVKHWCLHILAHREPSLGIVLSVKKLIFGIRDAHQNRTTARSSVTDERQVMFLQLYCSVLPDPPFQT